MPSLTFVASANAVATPARRRSSSTSPARRAVALRRAPRGGHHAAHARDHDGGLRRAPGELAALVGLADGAACCCSRTPPTQSGRASTAGTWALGVPAAFSFFSNKNLAVGEGGMVATDDDGSPAAAAAPLARDDDAHLGPSSRPRLGLRRGRARLQLPASTSRGRRRARRLDGSMKRTRVATRSTPATASELAGVGVAARCRRAERTLPPTTSSRSCSRRRRPRGVPGASRGGVQTSVHYPPVHRFSIYSDGAPDLPLTDAYAARTVTLPLFAHMSREQRGSRDRDGETRAELSRRGGRRTRSARHVNRRRQALSAACIQSNSALSPARRLVAGAKPRVDAGLLVSAPVSRTSPRSRPGGALRAPRRRARRAARASRAG